MIVSHSDNGDNTVNPNSDQTKPACQRCGTALQSNSRLCFDCFSRLYKPCPKCTDRRLVKGRERLLVKRRSEGRRRVKIHCEYCGNKRYVILPFDRKEADRG
jgi:hypothetical protein